MNSNNPRKIGVEVHLYFEGVQKMFCNCVFNTQQEVNTSFCRYCSGTPGTFPIYSQTTLNFMSKLLAYENSINMTSGATKDISVYRKHYLAPDLVNNFQRGTFSSTFLNGVTFNILGGLEVTLQEAHFEEDAGRLYTIKNEVFLDLNRSGALLLEVVTTPCFNSPEEVVTFIKFLVDEMTDLFQVKVNFRADLNLSYLSNPRVEIKNVNSYSSVIDAINYEFQYQYNSLKGQGKTNTKQIVKGWDEENLRAFYLRDKETHSDYNYMVDLDIPLITVTPVEGIEPLFQRINKLSDSSKIPHSILSNFQSHLPDFFDLLSENLTYLNERNISLLLTNSSKLPLEKVAECISNNSDILYLLDNTVPSTLPEDLTPILQDLGKIPFPKIIANLKSNYSFSRALMPIIKQQYDELWK